LLSWRLASHDGSGAKRRLSDLLGAWHQSLKEVRVFHDASLPRSCKLPRIE
jgi:hypothetical protein